MEASSLTGPSLWLHHGLRGLDRLRGRALKLGAGIPRLNTLIWEREARLMVLACLHTGAALTLTLLCPVLLLVLGPLTFGVVHVASDLRYLVLRPKSPRLWLWSVAALCPLLLGLRVVETAHLGETVFARIELSLVALWVLCAWLLPRQPVVERRSIGKLLLGGVGILALGVVVQFAPSVARCAFAHLHNAVALLLWHLMFRRGRALGALPLVPALFGVTLLWLTPLGQASHLGQSAAFGLALESAKDWLAPGIAEPFATRLVLSYVFLQSCHYAVWLILIPGDATRGRATPSFTMSYDDARADLTGWGLIFVFVAALGVAAAALFDPLTTQAVYLFVTPFHGYLELAALALFLRPGATRPPA